MPEKVELTMDEIKALYRLIYYMGWIPRHDEGITQIVNRITSIVRADELATRDSKTT